MELIKQLAKRTPFYHPLRTWLVKRKQRRIRANEYAEWKKKGKIVPPPHIVKQFTLQKFAKMHHLLVLVETGTYRGAMVEAMKYEFNQIYSIELSKELFEQARERFKLFDHIELILGDSGVELGNLVNKLNQPALFWLDGHFSSGDTARGEKETPIFEELNHILDAPVKEHVIIIDDARLFGTDPAYPCIEELNDFIKSKRNNMSITIQDDSIRVVPQKKPSKEALINRLESKG
jgi:hypothetical protein